MILNNNIQIALSAIRNNKLRTILTVMIIAVGITCLVGILTAIDTILFSLNDNFNKIGANSFSISPVEETIKRGGGHRRRTVSENISFDQAVAFKERFEYGGAKVAVSVNCTRSATASYADKKSDPSIRLDGIDDNFLQVQAFEVDNGRPFTSTEIQEGANRAIIGNGLVKTLFGGKAKSAINKTIKIDNRNYFIIGTLKEKGATNNSNDNRAFIPLLKAKINYGHPKSFYKINTSMPNSNMMDEAISEATGVMRNVRGLKPGEDNDFQIGKSDGLLEELKSMTSKIRMGTLVIALVTLLGASIGLMNIMLVSVTERTKEIGIRKALGATQYNIRTQFLTEAIVITQIGGILGIIFGIIIGFIVALLIKGTFIIPWLWMFVAIIVCIAVGLLAGLYPAIKAARLDPIEALRHA